MSLTPEESAALWQLAQTIFATAIKALQEAHAGSAAAKQTLAEMASHARNEADTVIGTTLGADDAVADNAKDARFPTPPVTP